MRTPLHPARKDFGSPGASPYRIELVRATAVPDVLSPFFRVTAADIAGFHDALDADPSVADRSRLDTFGDDALSRVEWDTGDVDVTESDRGGARFEITGTGRVGS